MSRYVNEISMDHRPPSATEADIIDATNASIWVGNDRPIYRTDSVSTELMLTRDQAIDLMAALAGALSAGSQLGEQHIWMLLQGER